MCKIGSPLHASAVERTRRMLRMCSPAPLAAAIGMLTNSIGAWPYSNGARALRCIGVVRCLLVQLAARCSVATCTHARPLRPPCYPTLCGSLPFSAAHVYTATGSYRSQRPTWRISTYQELSRARART